MTCPSSTVLSQAFSSGTPGELQGHLLTCPSCAAKWKELLQTRAAARELPYVTPDPERRAQVRKRLLAAAASQPLPVRAPTRARWLALAGAAAALLVVVMGMSRLSERSLGRARPSHFRAVVLSQGASRFVHERAGNDEWVRLSDGTLMVEVQPLQAGERFRVLCGDSEVEVRGTAFTTRVERDHLLSVDVLHGRVEVRPPDGQALLLGAGGHWQPADGPSRPGSPAPSAAPSRSGAASSSVAPAAAQPAVPPGRAAATVPAAARAPMPGAAAAAAASPPAVPGPAVRSSPAAAAPSTHATARVVASSAAAPGPLGAPPASGRGAGGPLPAAAGPAPTEPRATISSAERAFLDGWTALRQGHHQLAATSFARAAEQGGGAPSSSLVEDARFWRAVALARAGQSPLAITALRDFLQQHPGSARAGEATAILGWQLLRAGQLDQAQRCFAAAEKDSHAAIRDNARAGQAAVAARRQGQRATAAGSAAER